MEDPAPLKNGSSENDTGSNSKKPRIHLVKKGKNHGVLPMQVEDEVEIMDDSEDEFVVNRSSAAGFKRDYIRRAEASGSIDIREKKQNNLFKMNQEDLDDDNEEELSLLYEDEEELGEKSGEKKKKDAQEPMDHQEIKLELVKTETDEDLDSINPDAGEVVAVNGNSENHVEENNVEEKNDEKAEENGEKSVQKRGRGRPPKNESIEKDKNGKSYLIPLTFQ